MDGRALDNNRKLNGPNPGRRYAMPVPSRATPEGQTIKKMGKINTEIKRRIYMRAMHDRRKDIVYMNRSNVEFLRREND